MMLRVAFPDKGWNIANVPGGNIVVAPDETSVEGVVAFDRPSPYMGRWVSGIRWEFKIGQLVKYSAKTSADSFSSVYEKADGDKNRVGRIGIEVNPDSKRVPARQQLCRNNYNLAWKQRRFRRHEQNQVLLPRGLDQRYDDY